MNEKTKRLEELELAVSNLRKEIEEEKEEVIDFSKFVGKYGNTIVIKGEKLFKSFSEGVITYGAINFEDFKEKPTYTKTTLDELDRGDVFICCNYVEDINLCDFNIFVGKDNAGYYRVQHLNKTSGLEHIETDYYFKNIEVYKFNR